VKHSKRFIAKKDESAASRVVHVAGIVDAAVSNLVTCYQRLAEDLYRVHPEARRAVVGCLGNEGLVELILNRFHSLRTDEPDKAPSIEKLTRDAIARHKS